MKRQRQLKPLAERFWAKVNKQGPVHPVLGTRCWPWTGAKTAAGYGTINRGRREEGNEYATHVAFEFATGEAVPAGMCLLHRCDNPPCVRDEHLFLGTKADNVTDMDAKNRRVSKASYGEAHGLSKLTIDDVRAIRASSLGCTTLARQFRVSDTTIKNIRNLLTWKEVA